MGLDNWVTHCRVAMQHSLDILVRYDDCMRSWIEFEPAGNARYPWTRALKEFKGDLRTEIIKLQAKVNRVVYELDNTTHDDGKTIRLRRLFDDMKQCCKKVCICHINIQVKMEDFFHPGQNIIKRQYISDDDHVFPQEYYTGITRIQTLRRQIDYSSDLLPLPREQSLACLAPGHLSREERVPWTWLSDGDSQSD